MHQLRHPCSYVLTITARDRADEPRSSNATISVTVRDENDNPPIILNITSGITMVSVEEVILLDLLWSESSKLAFLAEFRHWYTGIQCECH